MVSPRGGRGCWSITTSCPGTCTTRITPTCLSPSSASTGAWLLGTSRACLLLGVQSMSGQLMVIEQKLPTEQQLNAQAAGEPTAVCATSARRRARTGGHLKHPLFFSSLMRVYAVCTSQLGLPAAPLSTAAPLSPANATELGTPPLHPLSSMRCAAKSTPVCS